MQRVPQRIGSVDIDDTLGRGGMGVVYVGRQPGLERRVVVKGLHGPARDDVHAVERFQREAQSMASVQHQNVVAVFDAFEWRQQPWIVQEYVDGADLAELLAHCRPLDPRLAALIALSMVRGLEEVHDRGIVHRDLKPSNVLLGRSGDVKICDFGIALDHHGPGLTRTGFALGTVPYMSPEQMLGEPVDFRSDLFSLGVLLYEMLCGEVPFPAQDPHGDTSLVRRIHAQRYTRCRKRCSAVPRWLAAVTEQCLRAKPRRRAASTTDLRRALERRLGHPSSADARAEIAAHLASIAGRATVARPVSETPVATDEDVDPSPSTRIAPEGLPGRAVSHHLWLGLGTAMLVLAGLAAVGAWAWRTGPYGLARLTLWTFG